MSTIAEPALRPAQPLLSIRGLSYRYPDAADLALSGLDLEIGAGEFLVLAGNSASGKSTLMRAACGLVPHFHGGDLAGSVTVAGIDALATGPGQLAEVAGYLAQDPETQVLSTTVAAEISLPLELRGVSPGQRARAVEEVALALAIPDLLERGAETLSGGELQRVALAAALVNRPKLILLDEPTSQLDPVAGDELIWLLRRLNAEWGVTVVLAEHRLERCLAAADRVIALRDGQLGFDGAPAEFLAWAGHEEPSLSTPAAQLFTQAGRSPLPTGVRAARLALAAEPAPQVDAGPHPGANPEQSMRGSDTDPARSSNEEESSGKRPRDRWLRRRDPSEDQLALRVRDLWVELGQGDELREVLRGLDLSVKPGEKVALMGRNGAGKSTLLRCLAGLVEPVRGSFRLSGGIALLSQRPGDYLVREKVGDELPGVTGAAALARVGLAGTEERDPRDLSGGERQRLALAIALAGQVDAEDVPGLVALDEPTRGLDRGLKQDLAALTDELAAAGAAVIIATHDVEFAARFANRVVLLGGGLPIADGSAGEVLSGGWYFATEVARILDRPGVILPEQGAPLIARNAESGSPAVRNDRVPNREGGRSR